MNEKGLEQWEEFKDSAEQRQRYLDSVFYCLSDLINFTDSDEKCSRKHGRQDV